MGTVYKIFSHPKTPLGVLDWMLANKMMSVSYLRSCHGSAFAIQCAIGDGEHVKWFLDKFKLSPDDIQYSSVVKPIGIKHTCDHESKHESMVAHVCINDTFSTTDAQIECDMECEAKHREKEVQDAKLHVEEKHENLPSKYRSCLICKPYPISYESTDIRRHDYILMHKSDTSCKLDQYDHPCKQMYTPITLAINMKNSSTLEVLLSYWDILDPNHEVVTRFIKTAYLTEQFWVIDRLLKRSSLHGYCSDEIRYLIFELCSHGRLDTAKRVESDCGVFEQKGRNYPHPTEITWFSKITDPVALEWLYGFYKHDIQIQSRNDNRNDIIDSVYGQTDLKFRLHQSTYLQAKVKLNRARDAKKSWQ